MITNIIRIVVTISTLYTFVGDTQTEVTIKEPEPVSVVEIDGTHFKAEYTMIDGGIVEYYVPIYD